MFIYVVSILICLIYIKTNRISRTRILYVTSFNQKLYDNSGKSLISSFKNKMNSNDNLLICHENVKFLEMDTMVNLIYKDISDNCFLKKWLAENKDIIPISLGGISTDRFSHWNYRASLWFRKIVSLHIALQYKSQFDMIVWIDSDCIIKRNIDSQELSSRVTNKHVGYVYGDKRKQSPNLSIETGVIIFNNIENFKSIRLFISEYKNRQFHRYDRWDDGYIFEMLINKKILDSIDLVENSKDINHPIKDTFLNKFITHEKGRHIDYYKKYIRK